MTPRSAALRAEIDAVLADWAWHLDHHEFDELAELFTEDARFVTGPVELRGREQIRQRYAARRGERSTRHLYSGLRLTEASASSVRARSTWACYAANKPAPVNEAPVYLIADFGDVLTQCADGHWRISERVIVPVFRDPALAPVT